jgi:hypothetical protein
MTTFARLRAATSRQAACLRAGSSGGPVLSPLHVSFVSFVLIVALVRQDEAAGVWAWLHI